MSFRFLKIVSNSQTAISAPVIVEAHISYSLDSDSKFHEDQEKRHCIFLLVDLMSQMAKFKMAANVYKKKHIYE